MGLLAVPDVLGLGLLNQFRLEKKNIHGRGPQHVLFLSRSNKRHAEPKKKKKKAPRCKATC
jgi:hypothetical protein